MCDVTYVRRDDPADHCSISIITVGHSEFVHVIVIIIVISALFIVKQAISVSITIAYTKPCRQTSVSCPDFQNYFLPHTFLFGDYR